ncbi:zinc-dependent peptidase [Duganella sp. BJB1802]|uniref:M90 family metallopeptidase n=1 Tax=Duganella sp. BJB1802 TaxID=2744575 RepID=UPI001593254B|nr:M90 family metallopeptidase [Duganella sp. BJB1802]NVD70880.1 zinc-dependent peptidase [Duganella sp. BJB1802]
MEALTWIGLTALLIALPFYYPRWRLRRVLAQPLPAEAVAVLQRNIPVYLRMDAGLRQQLQRLVVQFLHQKKFIGCEGLEVTDEMAVTIAGQACLLLLNRPTKVYPALHTILVYPGAFVARRAEVGPGGVVTPGHQSMLGESWDDGRVILSWDDVRRGAVDWTDGHNIVLHEFAHQLDSESGRANGAPYLGNPASYREWSEVLERDFQHLRHSAMYRQHSVMDHYGATNPAEFFAVATETFFEKPYQMAEHHAELFAEFLKYYRVDPRAWMSPPPLPPPEPSYDWTPHWSH